MNEDLLRELLITSKGVHAPPKEVPPELQQRFDAAIEKYCAPKVISESVMIRVLLKIVSEGRQDGGQIISKLNKAKVRLEHEGEGLIFALLARMEDQELILGGFDEAMTQRTYQVDEKGSDLLVKSPSSERNLIEQLALLWT
jgi:DNA-binding PadR family transcriptional regulator